MNKRAYLDVSRVSANPKEIRQQVLETYATNPIKRLGCSLTPQPTKLAKPMSKIYMKRSFLSATIAATIALIPFSIYAVSWAQDDGSINATSVHASADTIQFKLVPAAPEIANFTNAIVEVRVAPTEEELGTDTFTLTAKGLRPNTTSAVFLTELPVSPFGAVQYLADLTTNANGKGSVQVNAIIEEAFSSQVVNGQRVRKEINHAVFWFANPGDANDCFAPADAPITVSDGDGVAGPAAFSSQDTLPGAPLP